jgi:hypothetical protein
MLQKEKLTYRYDVLMRPVLNFLHTIAIERSDFVTARIGSKIDVRCEPTADVRNC